MFLEHYTHQPVRRISEKSCDTLVYKWSKTEKTDNHADGWIDSPSVDLLLVFECDLWFSSVRWFGAFSVENKYHHCHMNKNRQNTLLACATTVKDTLTFDYFTTLCLHVIKIWRSKQGRIHVSVCQDQPKHSMYTNICFFTHVIRCYCNEQERVLCLYQRLFHP